MKDFSRYKFALGSFNFASEEEMKEGDSSLRRYKNAVIATAGPTDPELIQGLGGGEEKSTLQFDLGPAIEAKEVFAPRLERPAGVPVYIGHDRSLCVGRVESVSYGEYEGALALFADLVLLEDSPDPRIAHVLQAVKEKVGIGLSIGMDPASVNYETNDEEGHQLVVFQSFDIGEVSLTPEPRVPTAHLFSVPLQEKKIMTQPIQSVRPSPPLQPAPVVRDRSPTPDFSAPPPPSGTQAADEAVYTFLATARKEFESNKDTVFSLLELGEQYRRGELTAAQVQALAMQAAKNHAGVEGLARDGSNPQGESERIATRMHETVPSFSMFRLMQAGLRRKRADPTFKHDEFELMSTLHQEFPSWGTSPGIQAQNIPGAQTFSAPSHALMKLIQAKRELDSGRPMFDFAQTYGTSTIGGSTGSAQIEESREHEYRRDLLVGFLRPSNVAMGLGIRSIPVTKDIVIPVVTSSTSFGWLGENASTAATGYDVTTMSTSPKRIGAHAFYSWQLGVSEGADGLGSYQLLMEELNMELDRQKELALFAGTGSGGQPTGITAVTGLNAITLTATPTLAQIVSFITPLMDANVDVNGAAWLTTPRWFQTLRSTLQTTTANSVFLATNGTMMQGSARASMDGQPVFITTNVPKIGSGNNEQILILGVWRFHLDISYAQVFVTIDDVTGAHQANTRIIVQGWCDNATQRPNAFSIGSAVI